MLCHAESSNIHCVSEKLDPLLFHHNVALIYELHENFKKYIEDVGCCKYGINVGDSLTILC